MEEPMMPPPTMTTCARSGGSETGSRIELSSWLLARRSGIVTSRQSMERHRPQYASRVTWYSGENAAGRAGVEPSYLARLVELGILSPEEPNRFSPGDVRRVLMARSLEDAGIPLDGVGAAMQR